MNILSNVLITACPHDTPTRYGYFYLRKAADVLARHGHKIVFLRTANLENFRKALVKYDPRLVLINGHGGYKAVTGCDNQILLGVLSYDPVLGKKIVRENPGWMAGRIVFLFTCNTGKELAKRLYGEGALAVAAFQSDYVFISQDSAPLKDERAYPFFNSPIQLPIILAEGGTWRQATQAVKDAFNYYYLEAEEKGDQLQAKYLNYNLANFVVYGRGNVTL